MGAASPPQPQVSAKDVTSSVSSAIDLKPSGAVPLSSGFGCEQAFPKALLEFIAGVISRIPEAVAAATGATEGIGDAASSRPGWQEPKNKPRGGWKNALIQSPLFVFAVMD